MTLKASFTTIRYHTAADPYHYTVDNRPLTDLKACLDFLADTMDTGFTTGTLTALVLRAPAASELQISSQGANLIRFWTNNSTAEQFRIDHVASSVNLIRVLGATTGNAPTLAVTGLDPNISLNFTTLGTGGYTFSSNSNSQIQFRILHTANAVNSLQVTGAAIGTGPIVSTVGADTNVPLNIRTQGTGNIAFQTNAGTAQFNIAHTASAVNFVQVTGGATGNPVSTGVQGSDTDIGFDTYSKGAGAFRVLTNAGNNVQFSVTHTIGANRNVTITGSNGGNPTLSTTAGLLAIQAGVTCGSSIRAADATAIPAGGSAGVGFTFSSTANNGIFFGSGVPTLSAAKGSLYLRSDGTTTNNRAYINTDGGTTWTALTTAA